MALKLLSEIDIGSIVKINMNGAVKEFIVVNQGRPSDIYDDSCDDTWLLMKDIHEKKQWHSSDVNDYANSTIHSYLNGTFLNLFEANIKNAIKQVKIPYRPGSGTSRTVNSGASGLSAKIFLLSGYEMGWTSSDNQNFPADGARVSYFDAGTGTAASNKRISYLGGTATGWCLRSPHICSSTYEWFVHTNGNCYNSSGCSVSYGVRPALVLPSSLSVSDDGSVKTNAAPTITCDLAGNIGGRNEDFTVSYSVNDDDGDPTTVTESLDGETKRTYTATLGETNTFDISGEYHMCIPNGEHTITITATDAEGASGTLELTFTKDVHALSITLATPKISPNIVSKTLLSVTKNIPPDANYTVTMTNNANDTTPVWEDATTEISDGKPHIFANQTATNGFAYNFMIAASRGVDNVGGWISGIRGVFQYAESGPGPDPEQVVNYTMLYDQGYECVTETGGWRSSSNNVGSVTKKSGSIVSSSVISNTCAYAVTTNKLHLDDYSSYGVVAKGINHASNLYGIIAFTPDVNPTINPNMFNGKQIPIISGSKAAYVDAIPGTGDYYLLFGHQGTRSSEMYAAFLIKSDNPVPTFRAANIFNIFTTPEALAADATTRMAILTNPQAVKILTLTCTGDLMYAILNNADWITAIKANDAAYRIIMANPHWSKFVGIIPAAAPLLNYTMLYDQGDECESVTGGWSKGVGVSGSITKNYSSIAIGYSSGSPCYGVSTDKSIDLISYTKAIAVVDHTADTTMFGVGDIKDFNDQSGMGYTGATVYAAFKGHGKTMLNLELSDINRSQYFGVMRYTSGNSNMYFVAALKSDPYAPWLAAAGITKAYASLDDLLADSSTLTLLMSNEAAVEYMVSCSGTLMAAVCQSRTAMTALVNNIAYDAAFKNPWWYKFMTMNPISLEVMDSVSVKVPVMTSNTTPAGEVFASSQYNAKEPAWGAFDGNLYSPNASGVCRWGSAANDKIGPYIGYDFGRPVCVYKTYAIKSDETNAFIASGRVQGSLDRTNWIDIGAISGNDGKEITVLSNALISMRYWRLIYDECIYTKTQTAGYAYLDELNFYGREAE